MVKIPEPGESHEHDKIGGQVADSEVVHHKAIQFRTITGLILWGAAALVIACVFLRDAPSLKVQSESTPLLAALSVGVHLIESLALMLLAYTLFRAGERLFTPRWLLRDSRHVALVKALHGNETAQAEVLKALQNIESRSAQKPN